MNQSVRILKFFALMPLQLASRPPRKPKVGGQAIIEGVMMRGRKAFSWAVRRADGEVVVEKFAFTSASFALSLEKRRPGRLMDAIARNNETPITSSVIVNPFFLIFAIMVYPFRVVIKIISLKQLKYM